MSTHDKTWYIHDNMTSTYIITPTYSLSTRRYVNMWVPYTSTYNSKTHVQRSDWSIAGRFIHAFHAYRDPNAAYSHLSAYMNDHKGQHKYNHILTFDRSHMHSTMCEYYEYYVNRCIWACVTICEYIHITLVILA
jgi:hypothetical protein